MPAITLREIAERTGGALHGPPDMKVTGISSLELAGPEQISFAVKPGMTDAVSGSRAGAFILPENWHEDTRTPHIRSSDPYLAYARTAAMFQEAPFEAGGVHETVVTGRECRLGKEITIGPGSVLGDRVSIGERVHVHGNVFIGDDVSIGDDCIIYPNVTIYHGCRTGSRVILHAGVVIGADGFGYARDGNCHVKIPQTGIVVIEDDVEIGANSTVDRAALGETRIGAGTKIDNLVMVAHNVRIGQASVIVSQTGISGSAELGNGVVLGGQTGIVGHIKIGDGAMVAAQSGVASSIPPGGVFSGSPAIPHRLFLRVAGLLKKLPEMARDIRMLKKRIEKIEGA